MKMKLLSAKLGGFILFAFLLASNPAESIAVEEYNYKILDYTERIYLGDGVWLRHDHCYHGPGLC